jgi:hypothetical protein
VDGVRHRPGQDLCDLLAAAQVLGLALHHAGALGQRGAARVAYAGAHAQSAPQQFGREVAADVAGRAGDEDPVMSWLRGAAPKG